MNTPERRQPHDDARLRAGLTAEQRQALETLEHFGWQLRFVRRPLFRDPIPVLFDRSGERYVVLQPDGSLDESQTLKLRD
ncbi:hypothetical protein [Stenotrophomonas rhizophila]|uniref:hypothetical protein n=1 Tax=Stenotrophomonas rhizophila TaxID=216778 RepID=UPI001E52AA74|nr:hypothetical protein [Stenotrophomonas rhizophila]MCC7635426.1 hypothetical protein [Stenotrophomonas rhizophila]MCC7664624.1 hypothetical protein [Stenotrophomonas rhizophila]